MTSQNSRANAKIMQKGCMIIIRFRLCGYLPRTIPNLLKKATKHRKNNVSFAFSANSNVAVTVSFLFTTI